MAANATNPYDIEAHVAEVYDLQETDTADIELIRRLINGRGPWRILEPFSGTGRILIPLAADGHELVGIDQARFMVEHAGQKVASLTEEARQRIRIFQGDVLCMGWPEGFDLVILGGNSLYELANPDEQQHVIRLAVDALKPGGYLYVDNNHMEGDLAASWQEDSLQRRGLQGVCADGTSVETWMQTVWFDAPRRLVQLRRLTRVRYLDGSETSKEYFQQKHPVSTDEVRGWLEQTGLVIQQVFGDRQGAPYQPESSRAIFWAQKPA